MVKRSASFGAVPTFDLDELERAGPIAGDLLERGG
jgi:hypothetical protein